MIEAGIDETRPLLSVRDLKVGFQTRESLLYAVNGVSLDLHQGETLAIVGESGCGKSLTALTLMGLTGTDVQTRNARVEGSILLHSNGIGRRELVGLSRREYDRLRGPVISMIFQEPTTALNPLVTVGDQIAEMLVKHRGSTKAHARERARELLTDVGIPDVHKRLRAYPHELSGGQNQRVMIAIAMSCEPSILIADEPTTALDVTIQSQVLYLLRQIKADHDTSIIFITHNLGIVAQFADRVAVMYRGRVVECAGVRELFRDPQHPYTRQLLGSLPKIGQGAQDGHRLDAIQGSVPGPSEVISGCEFHPRCPHVMERCSVEEPPEFHFEGGMVRCFLFSECER